MKEINCNVIRDILPLYLDNVVSQDTRELVEEHLQSCESCRKEAAEAGKDVVLNVSRETRTSEARILKKLKGYFLRKRVLLALFSAVAALAVAVGVYSILFLPKFYVPYDSRRIEIKNIDGTLYALYDGGDGSCALDPMRAETADGEKMIVQFYYYDNPWTRYISSRWNEGSKHMVFLGDADEVEEIYYGEFEAEDYMDQSPSVDKEAKLIWSR